MQVLPALVIRTRHTAGAVTVNGAHLGECTPEGYLSLPLSDCGEYYIGIWPLSGARYYGVMRKFTFRDGALIPPPDVVGYVWPGGIYEAILAPGRLPETAPAPFPFTVDRLALENGLVATLYYENGLRLAVEEGIHVRYGATLSAGKTGRLIPFEGGVAALAAEGPPTLLILDGRLRERLRIQADEITFEGGRAVSIERLSTLRGHERRQVWTSPRPGAAFEPGPAEVGFFTFVPPAPAPGAELIRAFCEAVGMGLTEEALSYMTPGLREGLGTETLADFLGPFAHCRAPLENQDRVLGLCSPREDGFFDVRVAEFTFEDGLIDDVSV